MVIDESDESTSHNESSYQNTHQNYYGINIEIRHDRGPTIVVDRVGLLISFVDITTPSGCLKDCTIAVLVTDRSYAAVVGPRLLRVMFLTWPLSCSVDI